LTTVNRAAGGEFAHSSPTLLPGGQAALFTIRRTGGAWADARSAATEPDWNTASAEVALLDLESGDYRTLIGNAHSASYSHSGHILFIRDQDLWAAAFDLGALAVSGPERIVRPGLQSMFFPQPNAPFALNAQGSAVFLVAAEVPPRVRSLVWVDRSGNREAVEVPGANRIESPRVSPDGKRILYVAHSTTWDIWVHERFRPGSRMRLTYDETEDRRPVWFPDSQQFLFAIQVDNDQSPAGFHVETFHHRADGAGRPEPWPRSVANVPGLSIPMAVLEDGHSVLYQEGPSMETLWDIADSSRPPEERYIVQTPAMEEDPVLSPDARWLAYSSSEAGDRQIYVRPYPDTQSARWQVTSEGGSQPLWSADGSELYYRRGSAMMAISVQTQPSFRASAPVKLFEGDFSNPDDARRDYDLEYPEGKRFLMVQEVEPDVPSTKFVFVENWTEELKSLLPSGRNGG
jgi:hypothetical protein